MRTGRAGAVTAETLATLSLRIFGTADYSSVLAILPAYDGSVKQFRMEAEQLGLLAKSDRNHQLYE